MKRAAIVTLLLVAAGATHAQAPTCWPPPIDTCGRGPVHGTAGGVEWGAWWVETGFDWRRVHWYRLPSTAIVAPQPGASSVQQYAASIWAANLAAGAVHSCLSVPHREALAACRAMVLASDATLPPPILYNVAAATSLDGTRPGYRLSATGALVADGLRHKADAWCECWRGAVKPGATQYCLVTQTSSYAACRRRP